MALEGDGPGQTGCGEWLGFRARMPGDELAVICRSVFEKGDMRDCE